MAYAIRVHKNEMPKNWLMRAKGLKINAATVRNRIIFS